ncbi:hypothetical protein Vadar_023726 [Vaccinium darrowii]|uniref:Uncharacterized protein n=1 Tax=Vaccinium darrowii TaxID=229202 RepID=A0ACB7XTW0_9ERIC|nr:hypothetical protein Vadar_023726 [Vaccinium darrowii]
MATAMEADGVDHPLEEDNIPVGVATALENQTNSSSHHPWRSILDSISIIMDDLINSGDMATAAEVGNIPDSIINSGDMATATERLMWFHLRRHGAPRGRQPNEHKVPVGGNRRSIHSPDEDMKPFINTLALVAALIATLTFAAVFTIPGGYDDLGSATLQKKAALWVFILSDTLAMCCSITVLLLLWWAMHVYHDSVFPMINASSILLYIALIATLVAFMSGAFALIATKALWVAILVCIVCSMVFCSFSPCRVERSSLPTWFMPTIIARDIRCFIQLKQRRNKRKRDQHYVLSLIRRGSPDTTYCVSNTNTVNS